LIHTIRHMSGAAEGKEHVLRRLRVGARGIAAMRQGIEAPVTVQSQAQRRREEQSRDQMRAALEDALAVQRGQMRRALEIGASYAEIAEAVGMTEDEVRRTLL
jgi:DNA-directed RNA polymerase specialized sigma24 family protein